MRSNEHDESYDDLHWGKYESPMAHYVSLNFDALTEHEWDAQADLGEYIARFGRRIYFSDGQGFVYLDTYATVQDAELAFQARTWGYREPDMDGDYIISPDYFVAGLGEKFADRDAAEQAILRDMREGGVYGDVWVEDDHGGLLLLALEHEGDSVFVEAKAPIAPSPIR